MGRSFLETRRRTSTGSTEPSALTPGKRCVHLESCGLMETVSSTMSDSPDSLRVGDVMEKYTEVSFGQVKDALPCLARDFGDVDFTVSASQDRVEDFLKLEPGPWEDITDKTFPLKENTNVEISRTDACPFIKDEREPALISASPRASFDISQSIDALDVTTSSLPVQTPLLDSGAGLLLEIPQPGALVSLSQMKPGAAVALGFDSAGVCKSEMGGWDPHLWFSGALAEERPEHMGFSPPEGIHSSSFIQRSHGMFSAFPG